MKAMLALLLAWSLFGGDKAPPEPDGKAVQAAAEKAVQALTAKAVKEAAEKAAYDAAAAKAAEERREKLREEAKADAEKLRLEARADAEKLRVEAREDAEKLRLEARADTEKQRAEEKSDVDLMRKQVETRIFRLNHASATEVAERLNNIWSGDFGQTWKVSKIAVAFPEPNSVMVTAPNMILDACEKAIGELDIEAPQVYIEARFVELGNKASHKVGIDWSMLDGMSGTASLGGGIQQHNVGKGVTGFTRTIDSKTDGRTVFSVSGADTTEGDKTIFGNSDGTISYFNGTLNFSQMSLTLRALDATEDAKTFSNPKIIVSSGKKAVVDMTTKYPNVRVSAKRTDASASTSLDIASNMEAIPGEDKFMFAKEAFFSWGILLEVTPRVGTNGLINVSIVPTISDREDWVVTGMDSEGDSGTISTKYPVIGVQRLVTEFNLVSGTTAVIGGLSITKEEQVDTGIPLLREIPWIGQRLFGSMGRVKTQKEIIVFVTVGLVNPRVMASNAGLPKNAVLGRQYTEGQKLEPGDRPQHNIEGIESLDLRTLDEQAKDPLPSKRSESNFDLGDYVPFTKDPKYIKNKQTKDQQ